MSCHQYVFIQFAKSSDLHFSSSVIFSLSSVTGISKQNKIQKWQIFLESK